VTAANETSNVALGGSPESSSFPICSASRSPLRDRGREERRESDRSITRKQALAIFNVVNERKLGRYDDSHEHTYFIASHRQATTTTAAAAAACRLTITHRRDSLLQYACYRRTWLDHSRVIAEKLSSRNSRFARKRRDQRRCARARAR